jgi:hypothetical protein
MPIGGAGVREGLPALRRAMEERQRDPSQLQIVPIGVLPDRRKLDYYQSIGISEVILRLPPASRELVLPRLDEYTQYL